jgi:ketosteroid isomerase-like protein
LDLSLMRTEGANLFHVCGGKVTRLVIYMDRENALADLGLEAWEMSEESTTPDLVERARAALDALGRADWDTWIEFFAPDAVWDMSVVGMGVFEGREAIRRFVADWTSAYEDYERALEEFRDLGHGVTLGVFVLRGRPTGSSGLVELRYAGVGTWVNGLIERFTVYTDIDEARAAAERLAAERG